MKKLAFFVLGFIFIFALTACDGELTLPSGVTLPTDLTTGDFTTDDLLTSDLTTDISTEIPTSGLTTDSTDTSLTTGVQTTETPTTTGGSTTTETPSTTEIPTTTETPTTTEEPTTPEPTTIREITIIFDSQGGSAEDTMVVPEIQETVLLPTPERLGYTFDNWYTSLEYTTEFMFSPTLDDQVTAYAKWIPIDYQISYYDLGQTEIVDYQNPAYTSFVFTRDFQIYASGYLYLDSSNKNTREFEVINHYFDLNEGEIILSITGNRQLFALTSENRVFAWGLNSYGSLGTGDAQEVYTPTDITGNFNLAEGEVILYIDGDFDNSAAITSHGRVFTWGYNSQYQVGDGSQVHRHLPYDLTPRLFLQTDEMVIDIDFGTAHTVILTNFGRIFTFGYGNSGQLGMNNPVGHITTPTPINNNFSLGAGDSIQEVEVGSYTILILTTQGRLFVTGHDGYGQFGIGRATPYYAPTDITDLLSLEEGDMIIDIQAEKNNTIISTANGKVYGLGINDNNQFFIGTETYYIRSLIDMIPEINMNVDRMVFTPEATFFMDSMNNLYAIGSNYTGHFGSGNFVHETEPYLIEIPGTSQTLLHEELLAYESTLDLFEPTKPGHTFMGWYEDPDLTNQFFDETMPMADISLYAKWLVNQYSIMFQENGGSLVDDIRQEYHSPLMEPTPPTREGYTFLGWFEDPSITIPFIFDYMPMTDITLYAGWQINAYDMIFVDYDGEDDLVVTENYQALIDPPTDPVKEGYTFDGWYTEPELTNEYLFMTMPLNGITLYAKWSINQYTISFEENGGSEIKDISADYMTSISPPDDPSQEGYTFAGWYMESTYDNLYTFDTMPASDLTLYAKWQANTYTISFEEGGGTDVIDIQAEYMSEITLPTITREGYRFLGWYVVDAEPMQMFTETQMPAMDVALFAYWQAIFYHLTFTDYNESGDLVLDLYFQQEITVPEDPSKTGFTFDGWYTESTFENLYTFDTMPSKDIVLYPKWIDANDPTLIFNQINQAPGSLVTVRGTVYAMMKTGVNGFLIFDSSGYVAIDGMHDGLAMGDLVEISGTLFFDQEIPFISMVTSISVISSSTESPPVQILDMKDISNLTIEDNFKVFQIQGLLLAEESMFYIIDPMSLEIIPLNPDALEDAELLALAGEVGNQISLTFALALFGNELIATPIEYTITPLTTQEIALIIQNSMINNHDLVFYPGDVLPINEFPILGDYLTYTIPTESQTYFDTSTHTFLSTEEDIIIPFDITLTYLTQSYTFTINVTLKALVIASIAEVIDDTSQSYHTIEALVVSKGEVDVLLKDDTGYLYAYNPGFLQVGDMVRLIVRNDRDYPMTYLDYYDGDIFVKHIISQGNDLQMASTYYTGQDLLALNQEDMHIYGQYVEIRGFIQESHGEYNFGFFIHTENYDLPIMALGHSGFEKLFDYVGVEVFIKGYIYRDFDGNMMLYFEGIRDDIIIPTYTDQEKVDVLEYMFNYYLGGQTFDAFQAFELMPYHPFIGGQVSWEFTDPNFAYFDYDNHQFLYSLTDQPFTMTVTITSGSVTKTIDYQSQLNAITITPINQIDGTSNGEIFTQGLVIFQSHEYVIIMDDLGHILYVEIDQANIYVGDQVLLYGYISRQYNAFYLTETWDVDLVQAIYSRDNPVSIPVNQTSIDAILQMNDVSDFNKQIYVEVDGKIEFHNDIPYIYSPEGMIILQVPYDQVLSELYAYQGQYVSLRGFIVADDKYYSEFSGRYWTMNFVGEPMDIQAIDLTTQEKFDFLEADILSRYQITLENQQSMDFNHSDFYFPNVSITYTPLDDTLNLFDFSQGRMQYLETVTTETTVTIQVDLSIDTDTHTFTFLVTVTPTFEPTITTVDSLLTDGTTTQYIQGQVIVASYIGQEMYAMLVDDGTGRIIVVLPRNIYQSNTGYYHRYINDEILIRGLVTNTDNQLMIHGEMIELVNSTSPIMHSFVEISLADLHLLDSSAPNYIGSPYLVSGHLELVPTDSGDSYYLHSGDYMIRIFVPDRNWSNIRNYIGYEIKLRGFTYGLDNDGLPAFLYTDQYYGSDYSIELADYDEATMVEMMKQSLLADVFSYNPLRGPDDYVRYPGLPSVLINNYPETVITYEIIQGNEYVTEYDNYYMTGIAPMDVEIVVKVTITLNTTTTEFTYSNYLNGYAISSLTDLFDPTPSTQEIALEAIVLHSGFNSHYFEIDNQVYHLNLFMYGGLQKGSQVIIIGQKSVINGVADYTYNVQVLDLYTPGTIGLSPVTTTIETLYTNDYDLNPIHKQINNIYGQLGYDPYLDLFTLTDNGRMVYIEMLQEGWEYIDYLSPYLGEYIYVDVLLPRRTIRDEFIKVDAFNGPVGITLKDYTSQEDVALIKQKIADLGTIDVFGGDDLTDYIMTEYPHHPYTSISFTLVNSADALLFDENYLVFNDVSAQMSVQLLATITYNNYATLETFTDTITIDFNIHPRPFSSITDVLYGQDQAIYKIQGIIVAFGPSYTGNAYMIVFDGSEEIRVDLNLDYYSLFNKDGLSLNLHDEVIVIGTRNIHNVVSYVTPKLDDITIINVISSNNTITDTPSLVTLEDLLDQSLTDMRSFQDYITITGTLHWFGDSSQPIFYLESERLTPNGINYRIVIDYPADFTDIETLKALDGQTITVTGYTRGFESLRVPLGWHMIYQSHEVVVE